ncbi:C4-dicarboxylate transporter DcuC [Murimonas intestini]|uniref:C4-dicarboxylate transporter DcuC n=1 Tax=Murimonas intestini TaxID=1337051 RepID=UPI0011DE2DDD|nr:C4-dicarboxylate transporter DcuC [Murimonas intestini]
MVAVKLLITFVMFALVLIALKKKINFAVALTMIGIAGIFAGGLINGTTPMEENSTGILFFDVFEYFKSVGIVSTITGAGINILTIVGYVAYMDYLKASTLFALLAARPIMRIRNKYLIAWATFVFASLLLLVIPNGTGRIALLFGTVYPILLACGVSRATAATSIFAGVMYLYGPTSANIAVGAGYMGYENFNLAEHFVRYEWPWAFGAILAGSVVFIFMARHFDKKENAQGGQAELKGKKIEELGIPKYYALFPVFPLVMMILFSGLVGKLPTLSIPCVELMCFTLVFGFVVLTSKNRTEAVNGGFEFFKSMGKTLTNILGIVIGGAMFGKAVMQIGGIGILLQPFVNAGTDINLPLFIILSTIVGLFVGVVAANNYVPMTILGPVYAAIIASFGANPDYLILTMCNVPQFAIGMSPATAHIAMTSQSSGVPIPTILKRAFLPQAVSILVYLAGACIMA